MMRTLILMAETSAPRRSGALPPHIGTRKPKKRRGVVVVQVALWLVVIFGLAALTVDTGLMYNAKGEMQRTADAAGLAAASLLAAGDDGDPLVLARAAALEFADRNDVLGRHMQLSADDIQFGRAVQDLATRQYTFTPTENSPNAVRVVVRQTKNSPNGALRLMFAGVFGKKTKELSAEAIGMLVPRDIAVVADLSGSHSDDSELKNYKNTTINLWDVWNHLPGGIGDPNSKWTGNEFAADADGYSPQMAGPAWGYMKAVGFGTETLPSSYDPAADPGLVNLPYNQNWSNTTLRNALVARGYTTAEVNALFSNSNDSKGAYEFRVAAALGLANWNSGMSGGLWSKLGIPSAQKGNGNTQATSSELIWTETVMSETLSDSINLWRDYINNYMRSTSTGMYQANSAFRYRFGVKTFIDYLLAKRGANSQTAELAGTPHQPMQSVKDAVGHLAATVDELQSRDQVSLEVYGTTGRHEVDLTLDPYAASNRLQQMQAGYYDSWTNMGAGILRGIQELDSSRARGAAKKVMILITDGVANVACETCSGGNESGGRAYSRTMAEQAASKGIQIFTVSVGSTADQALMAEIAALGKGEHFHAEGTIAEYSARLDLIFQHLGGKRMVQLIR